MRPYLLAAMAVAVVAAIAQPVLLAQETPTAVFSAHAELVVLHVTVKDHGADVAGLQASAFTVFDDDRPQTIEFFANQDSPADVGLIIDASRSMLASRDRVVAAAGAFVDTSNAEDEIFALAFNEYVRAALPPQFPFTSDARMLRTALAGAIAAEGRTALYDATLAGVEYLSGGRYPRKALVVISDGGDNASTATFAQVLQSLQASNTVVYTVALPDPVYRDANPRRLKQLARATGGTAFEPRGIMQVSDVMSQVADEIRHTYTVGFVPAETTGDGRVRPVRVIVKTPDGRALSARTRQGYMLEAQ